MLEMLKAFVRDLSRPRKRAITIAFDLVALFLVIWLCYSLRYGVVFWPTPVQLLLMALAPAIAIPIFVRLGLYRAVIRYLPTRAILAVSQAMALSTLVWVTVVFITERYGMVGVPRSIPFLYWVFGTIVVGGSRFAVKHFLGPNGAGRRSASPVLIYGADAAGVQLAQAIGTAKERSVAGFVDDDPTLQGRDVMGIRVFPPAMIGELIRNYGIHEIIVSMPSIPASRRQEIYNTLSVHAVKLRTLPAMADLASGKYSVSALREIDIDDLLGRSSVPPNPELLRKMIGDRVILVTGAGGSIGSELTRLISRWGPKKLVLLEANEFALYEIERYLRRTSGINPVPVLGSVTDCDLVRQVIGREAVEVVFHAAAHKHVPLVEANAIEGVRNNVFGTESIARAALEGGVKDFVLISTDKAVRPTSVMGATKRWAEIIIRACAEAAAESGSGQRFCAVRFGNVLGSNGSVVPLFKEQIAQGGPVTLTHNDMTRYFMSVHEAAELIVQAGALSEGKDVFLLEMGEPVRIRDLAENMVRLAGRTVRSDQNPDGDIAIEVIGPRVAEKLQEQLFYDPALATRTSQPKILKAKSTSTLYQSIGPALAELAEAMRNQDEAAVRRILFGFIAD